MAYATLGVVYGNLSQTKQQQENLSKAFELKDRASEREKLYISAHYYSEGTGETGQSSGDLRAVEADLSARNRALGQSGAALPSRRDNRRRPWPMPAKRMRLDPKDIFSFPTSRCLPESRSLRRSQSDYGHKPLPKGWDPRRMLFRSTTMAFARGDKAGMQRAMDLAKGPSVEPIMLLIEGMGQCSLGKIQSARQSFAQGIALAQKSGLKELAAGLRQIGFVLPCRGGLHGTCPAGSIRGAGRFERSRHSRGRLPTDSPGSATPRDRRS